MEIKTTEEIIVDNPISRLICMSEVERENNRNKKWISVDDVIYFLSKFKQNCLINILLSEFKAEVCTNSSSHNKELSEEK